MTGFLNDGAIEKAIEAFGEFRQVIEEMKVHTTRAIATSATREAINGDNLVNRIYNSSGVQLERISGGEEARLVQLAVTRKVDIQNRVALVIDIGGGSVEFDVIDHGSIIYSNSLRLGTVRLQETFLADGYYLGSTDLVAPGVHGAAARNDARRHQPIRN